MSLSEMNKEQHDETCAALAAICLADGDLTGDNISKIIAASGTEVEEEKEEEKEEEEEIDMGGGDMFGGDDDDY